MKFKSKLNTICIELHVKSNNGPTILLYLTIALFEKLFKLLLPIEYNIYVGK